MKTFHDGMSPELSAEYSHIRCELRRAYINSIALTKGTDKWNTTDDAYLDMLDRRAHEMMLEGGRFPSGVQTPATIVRHTDGPDFKFGFVRDDLNGDGGNKQTE